MLVPLRAGVILMALVALAVPLSATEAATSLPLLVETGPTVDLLQSQGDENVPDLRLREAFWRGFWWAGGGAAAGHWLALSGGWLLDVDEAAWSCCISLALLVGLPVTGGIIASSLTETDEECVGCRSQAFWGAVTGYASYTVFSWVATAALFVLFYLPG